MQKFFLKAIFIISVVVFVIFLFQTQKTFASWTTNGTAISTAVSTHRYPQIVADGSGGAIITWEDYRNGNYDIYAQKINAKGEVQWTTNGVAICTASGNQGEPQIISDGSGGAIITWEDYRSGSEYDIYAQKINSGGTVGWTANGVVISSAANNQTDPQIATDGSGGAIVTWDDYRSGSTYDVYAQKINSQGVVGWTANGVAISTAVNDQQDSQIISDGSNGAIITWTDNSSGSDDVYAQKINSGGAVLWVADGVAISTAASNQNDPQIISDGSGGAIITWEDNRSGSGYDIYAQKIDSGGTVGWTVNGVAISSAANNQSNPQITSDGSGGAIITWVDQRSNFSIYSQMINSQGVVQWTADGVLLAAAASELEGPQIISDGSGGAIITWYGIGSSGLYDIYAQKINSQGTVLWQENGVGVSIASNNQGNVQITSDGSGGGIITWQDWRSNISQIYAYRVFQQSGIDSTFPATTASPAGGTYNAIQTVTLSAQDNEGGSGIDKIYYTTDGSTPTTSSSVYTSFLILSSPTTLKFFATDLTENSESAKTETYLIDTIAPATTASPSAGTYKNIQTITLSASDNQGGVGVDKIYYTTNGKTPTASSKVYRKPVIISRDTTLKFFAKDKAGNQESIKTAKYKIKKAKFVTKSKNRNEILIKKKWRKYYANDFRFLFSSYPTKIKKSKYYLEIQRKKEYPKFYPNVKRNTLKKIWIIKTNLNKYKAKTKNDKFTVKLTFKYSTSKFKAFKKQNKKVKEKDLVLKYRNSNVRQWRNLSASLDTKKNTLTITFPRFLLATTYFTVGKK